MFVDGSPIPERLVALINRGFLAANTQGRIKAKHQISRRQNRLSPTVIRLKWNRGVGQRTPWLLCANNFDEFADILCSTLSANGCRTHTVGIKKVMVDRAAPLLAIKRSTTPPGLEHTETRRHTKYLRRAGSL